MKAVRLGGVAAFLLVVFVGFIINVSAEQFTGGSYTIDASVIGNSFGGSAIGGSYQLTTSGGESVIGQGSGGSYRLDSGYVAQLQSSLQLAVQPGGLAAYYPLEETSGTRLADWGANALAATASNGPVSGTGKVGNGWIFDGVDDKISPGNPAGLSSPTELTWSAWVYPTDVTKDQMILSKQSTNYLRLINTNKRAFMSLRDNGVARTLTGTTTFANNQWYHIAGTFKAGEMKLYVNGISEASRMDVTGPLNFNTGNFDIGQYTNADLRTFVGTIDEVKVWSRALSPDEIKAEYDAGVAGTTAGLGFAAKITPGASQTSPYDAIVVTDSPNGYTLAVNQNQNLTNGSYTIPPVGSSIASPGAWVEGSTKGLGFTLFDTNATPLDGKWGSGNAYAAFPGSAISYYTRVGKPAGVDVLNMRLRLDVSAAQVAGPYTNVITTTGTMTP